MKCLCQAHRICSEFTKDIPSNRKGEWLMYQKVLVPLDGSELAERALPELMKLCRGGVIGEVIVLKVNETEVLTLPKAYDRSIDFAALRNARCAESMQY